MVTKYEPEYRVRVPSDSDSSVSLGTLRSVFASGGHGASGKNSYTPFSVTGRFDSVTVKGGDTLRGVKGTIFGIACPPWAQEISYKDIQCSFLAEDKVQGGKVEDFEMKQGEVYWAIGGRYHLVSCAMAVPDVLCCGKCVRANGAASRDFLLIPHIKIWTWKAES